MCLTLPETLITIAGIDKVIPRYEDLGVLLHLLPRSATGERMNPYNSIWTGVHANDGPKSFHVVLMDNARTEILADAGRSPDPELHSLRGPARTPARSNRQTGGHAYGSVYAGPIGAILTPQLMQMEHAQSLPYASSLCGACYEVCPVKINIPEVLIHLRNKVVKQKGWADPEALALKLVASIFLSERRFRAAQRLGRIAELPLSPQGRSRGEMDWLATRLLGGWTQVRDLQSMPKQSFREWWDKRAEAAGGSRG